MEHDSILLSQKAQSFIISAAQSYYRNHFVEGFPLVLGIFQGRGCLAFLRSRHEEYMETMKAFGVPEQHSMPDGHPGINKLYKRIIRGEVSINDAIPKLEVLLKELYENPS